MGYDVEQIQDFIEQLKWSLRVDHFELTGGPAALDPELVDQVKRYAAKRGIRRLLSLFSLTRDDPAQSEADMQNAMKRFARNMAAKRGEQLRHLEALSELLQEAFAHAAGREYHIKVPASKVLDGSWDWNDE
jgi:hypothetical protein